MKKITSLLMALLPLWVMAQSQGWPANYDGVMLQGFYWDSYTATKWNTLSSQADDLGQFFDLIWVPNSGSIDLGGTSRSMGYAPVYWLKHNTIFGSESDLRSMIKTFKAHNTGMIMDLVINHKSGATTWVNFPQETVKGTNTGKTYTVNWDLTNYSQICSTDECNNNGYKTTGAADTGEDFDGSRDLDHTNATTQSNVKTYMDFLLNELGYVGFRLDMTKGYAPKYTGIYNYATKPEYSVAEYWDGNADLLRAWLDGTKQNGQIQSGVFDYALKYRIKEAFGNNNWSALSDKGLCADPNYQRYAITFVDNHDTGQSDNADCQKENVMAANAFILTMPGTPCIFLTHYMVYGDEIRNCIKARRAAGITNQSSVTTQSESNSGYILATKGSKGSLYLQLGGATSNGTPSGYKLVQSGNNYKMFITSSIDWEHVAKDGTTLGYPVVSMPSGNYSSSVTTTVAPSKSGTTLVYTTDGTNPTSSSNRLTSKQSFTFSKSTTLKVGVLYNGVIENIETYLYNIGGSTSSITIYIRSGAADASYIWAWNTSNTATNYTGGTWPGKKISTLPTTSRNGVNWYYLTCNATNVSLLFNKGTGGYESQTADITNITTDAYFIYPNEEYADLYNVYNNVTELYSGSNSDNSAADHVYMLGHINGSTTFAPNQGYELTSTDGENYKGNFTLTDASGGYGWFSFTKKLGSSASDWSSIESYRFCAPTNNYLLDEKLGQTITCSAMGTNVNNAFKLVAGSYKIALKLSDRTFVIEEGTLNGDVNLDGKVDAADIACVVNIITGKNTAGTYGTRDDVNLDGKVDSGDIAALVSIITGTGSSTGTGDDPTNPGDTTGTGGGDTTIVDPGTQYDPIYILGEVNGNSWAPNKGVAMTSSDGTTYTAQVTTAGENSGYSYFSFTKALAETETDWDGIASSRFGAASESDFLVSDDLLGTPMALGADGTEVAFKIGAGSWTFTVDLSARTLTITGEGTTPEPSGDYDNIYILGEVNGNSWAPNVGVAMTSSDGKTYTAQVTTAGENSGYSYFSFSKALAETADDWSSIASSRFGAASESDFLVSDDLLGTAMALGADGTEVAFKIGAGTWTFTVDMSARTLTITGEGTTPEPSGDYDNIYILGEVNGNSWDPSKGVEMTTTNGTTYTAHVTTAGENSGYSYFSFTKALASSSTDWSSIASSRFGATGSSDYLITTDMLGTAISLGADGTEVAFKIGAGEWDFTVDMTARTLTITGEGSTTPTTEYDNIYILGEVNGNSWDPSKGVEMTTTDGVNYTTTVTTAGENSGYSYFSFTKKLASSSTDWSSIASYRFGAVSDGDFLVTDSMIGTPLSLDKDGTENAFKIGAGTWNLAINMTARTLTITK